MNKKSKNRSARGLQITKEAPFRRRSVLHRSRLSQLIAFGLVNSLVDARGPGGRAPPYRTASYLQYLMHFSCTAPKSFVTRSVDTVCRASPTTIVFHESRGQIRNRHVTQQLTFHCEIIHETFVNRPLGKSSLRYASNEASIASLIARVSARGRPLGG